MKFTTISEAKRLTGLAYLGNVSTSSKHAKAEDYGELTYGIYLAPANISGYEVCPKRTAGCTAVCLHESGHNRIDKGNITKARINKTQLFFKHREFFVDWMIAEITAAKKKAVSKGMKFSVRINNTSDITPISFYTTRNGKKINILEMFPDIQFYDYTKVGNRVKLAEQYDNYDLTFSYSGENMEECKNALENGVRVAMVFGGKLPETYMGYPVVDGDAYDMRYKDEGSVIVGLKYKKTKTQLESDNSFVIQEY